MEAPVDLSARDCTCDPGPEGQHRYWCESPDLSVRFEEPTVGGLPANPPEPTVGGLTGAQHRQLRLWETEAELEDETEDE